MCERLLGLAEHDVDEKFSVNVDAVVQRTCRFRSNSIFAPIAEGFICQRDTIFKSIIIIFIVKNSQNTFAAIYFTVLNLN